VGPVNLRLLAGEGSPQQEGLLAPGPQPRYEPAYLHDARRVAPEADHLVDAGGPKRRVALEGFSDEGQVGVRHPGARRAGTVGAVGGHGRPDGVRVHSELGGDGADLPVLGVVEAADLGGLLGGDHLSSLPLLDEPAPAPADDAADAPGSGSWLDRIQLRDAAGQRPPRATLIRHAAGQPEAVGALAVGVVETSLGALLVAAVGGPALLAPRDLTARGAAVALAPVAGAADEEDDSAALLVAAELIKRRCRPVRHPAPKAGLDRRRGS